MTEPGELQELLLNSLLHDLKNQAHHLVTGMERLAPAPGQEAGWLRLRQEAIGMGDRLTEALLAIRLGSHHHGLQLDMCAVQTLLEDVADAVRERLVRAGIALDVLPCPGLSHFLDEQLVAVTLRAATDNAARHARSRVRLSARTAGDALLLCIEDDGDGYPQNLLRDPDGAVTSADTAQRRTGLGLHLARLVARAHQHENRHGRLELDRSQDLGGALFRLLLP